MNMGSLNNISPPRPANEALVDRDFCTTMKSGWNADPAATIFLRSQILEENWNVFTSVFRDAINRNIELSLGNHHNKPVVKSNRTNCWTTQELHMTGVPVWLTSFVSDFLLGAHVHEFPQSDFTHTTPDEMAHWILYFLARLPGGSHMLPYWCAVHFWMYGIEIKQASELFALKQRQEHNSYSDAVLCRQSLKKMEDKWTLYNTWNSWQESNHGTLFPLNEEETELLHSRYVRTADWVMQLKPSGSISKMKRKRPHSNTK